MRIFIAISLAGTLMSAASAPMLTKVASYDLPGPGGKRFDYLTIDPDDHYLLSAHLAAGQTYVIDIRTNKIVATACSSSAPRLAGRRRIAIFPASGS